MKWSWLLRKGSDALLIFCNGWGMDEHVVAHLRSHCFDVLMLYAYDSFALPEDMQKEVIEGKYCRRALLGWSMGVWMGSRLFAESKETFDDAVALNGTLRPVDDRFGIPGEIFQKTWAGMDEKKTLFSFFRRCCKKTDMDFFFANLPQRTLADQLRELTFIKENCMKDTSDAAPWKRAAIARHDLIFPARNQQTFWQGQLPVTGLSSGHYPFTLFPLWEDYLHLQDISVPCG